MWTDEQRRRFEETGVLRLPGAFPAGQAAAMADAVWHHLEGASQARRDDAATWTSPVSISFKKLKSRRVFDPLVDNAAVRDALDDVFGVGGWAPPKRGAQVLVTFPTAGPWRLPERLWHMDCGFERPTWPAFAVKLFACIGEVRPEGGATLVLAGSHRLVDRYRAGLAPAHRAGDSLAWGRFMRHDPWLAELVRTGPEPERTRRLLGSAHDADGIPLQIVELVGAPGDVYLTHLHVFHCVAPNTNPTPRLMLGKLIVAHAASTLAGASGDTSSGAVQVDALGEPAVG